MKHPSGFCTHLKIQLCLLRKVRSYHTQHTHPCAHTYKCHVHKKSFQLVPTEIHHCTILTGVRFSSENAGLSRCKILGSQAWHGLILGHDLFVDPQIPHKQKSCFCDTLSVRPPMQLSSHTFSVRAPLHIFTPRCHEAKWNSHSTFAKQKEHAQERPISNTRTFPRTACAHGLAQLVCNSIMMLRQCSSEFMLTRCALSRR